MQKLQLKHQRTLFLQSSKPFCLIFLDLSKVYVLADVVSQHPLNAGTDSHKPPFDPLKPS